jgi:hypothetical protein
VCVCVYILVIVCVCVCKYTYMQVAPLASNMSLLLNPVSTYQVWKKIT